MRLTPLGVRVIAIAPLVPAAVIAWAIVAALPFFNGASLLGVFVIAVLVSVSNFVFQNYGHTPRHAGGRSMQGAYHVSRHGA
jgi:dolichol kinase